MKLSKNIYNLRKRKGISQELLAEKIKVSRQTISNWELGETAPNPEQLVLLANIFDISVDELIGHSNKIVNSLVKKDIVLCILVFIFAVAMVVLLILLFKEKDKNTYKLYKNTKPTITNKITSNAKIDDTFIRTFEVLEINKVICNSDMTGCDETTFNVTLKQCKKETKELQISNSFEFKKLEKGKTYEFKFEPVVGEVYYTDEIVNIFAFNKVVSITETNKKCNNQIQDAIKTRSI